MNICYMAAVVEEAPLVLETAAVHIYYRKPGRHACLIVMEALETTTEGEVRMGNA